MQREFTFNGQRYRVGPAGQHRGRPDDLSLRLRVRLLLSQPRLRGRARRPEVHERRRALDSPIGREFTRAVAPIPGIGVAGRGYVTRNVSITGEVTFFKVPESLGKEEFGGRYLEYDFYGTVNFTDNVGRPVRPALDRRRLLRRLSTPDA